MSLKDKAKKIDFGALPGVGAQGGSSAIESVKPSATDKPKTAPGLMMAHAGDQRSELLRTNEELKLKVASLEYSVARVDELQEELSSWDGAKAARRLDPQRIKWSGWVNRDELNFKGSEYLELKEEIASAGGNVQPIKVRPLAPGGEHDYEVVFGHRRHRACLELGLPVLALIDNVGDIDLFVEMDRENRSRKNLSAWEQGRMYQRALDQGLFPSNRQLAEKVGADLAQVGKALALARLPQHVVDAFASPLDLQFRFAKVLSDAVQADPDGVKRRAKKAHGLGAGRSPKTVLEMLVTPEVSGGRTVPPPVVIERAGNKIATVSIDEKGRAAVVFEAGSLEPEQLKALASAIESFIDGR